MFDSSRNNKRIKECDILSNISSLFNNIILDDHGNVKFIFNYYITNVEFPDILKSIFTINTKSFQPVDGHKSLMFTATFNVPESKINQLYIY